MTVVEPLKPILRGKGAKHEEGLPKGLGTVLHKQTTGFWGKLSNDLAKPDFSQDDIPDQIYTFDPWLGCMWGKSCKFCYVPNVSEHLYPGGHGSYWYKEWGQWLIPKPDVTERLQQQLFDRNHRTRAPYKGAFIYMSPKTDPFLPLSDTLQITLSNLRVFLEADVFLVCQTRSPKIAEDLDIFSLIIQMARRKKVGVSFSISTDILEEQRRIEGGGLSPDGRMAVMMRLKEAGVFISAAVSPLISFSPAFPQRLIDCAHHASIQLLRSQGYGSTTPERLLSKIH